MKKNVGIWLPIIFMVALVLIVTWISTTVPTVPPQITVPYSSFKEQLLKGNVETVTLIDNEVQAALSRPIIQDGSESSRVRTYVPSLGDPNLLPLLEERKIEISARSSTGVLDGWLSWLLPLVFVLVLYGLLWRPMLNSMGGPSRRWRSA